MRIPHEFNLEAGKTFEIKRRGRELVLIEQEETLAGLIDVFKSFPVDFFADGRYDPPPEPVMWFDENESPTNRKRAASIAKQTKKPSVLPAK